MSNKTLYLECYSGISGDMTVSALLDLGADAEVLKEALDSLRVDGYEVQIGRREKCGIDGCYFDVVLENEHHHSHHDHGHEHHHDHSHDDHSHQHGHQHVHRNIHDIYEIIDNSQITEGAKNTAKKIFDIVAKAESKAHGVSEEKVHFHEVGAVDSIVDIVAVAVCIDNLDINDVYVSELYEGSGHVKCQHGILPIPVPAVANIIMEHQLELRKTDIKEELVTPTGAAIVAALKTKDRLPDSYIIKNIGIGAGQKELPKANILRAYIIEESKKKTDKLSTDDEIWVLESNIDDSTGEALGFTMEKLLNQGARDAFYTPIYMKKNRPAYKLTVICKKDTIEEMEDIIFRHTTSIGIRKSKMMRSILQREEKIQHTIYGQVRVKECRYKDEVFVYPEYQDVKRICNETGHSFQEVYHEIKNEK